MFDDMMHRGLWFAPTWPMMRERAAGYLLSGIELGHQTNRCRCRYGMHHCGYTTGDGGGSHISSTAGAELAASRDRVCEVGGEGDDRPRPSMHHNIQQVGFAERVCIG